MSFAEIDRQERECVERAHKAQALAAQAFERLLSLAEKSDSRQARRVLRMCDAWGIKWPQSA